jgi:hypothetical protein
MVLFVNYASDLFQVEVSHLYDPRTLQFTLILHIPLVSNTNLLELYEFLPLPIHFNFSEMSQSLLMSARTTFWPLDSQNLFKLSPALICIHASTSETPSFAREGK